MTYTPAELTALFLASGERVLAAQHGKPKSATSQRRRGEGDMNYADMKERAESTLANYHGEGRECVEARDVLALLEDVGRKDKALRGAQRFLCSFTPHSNKDYESSKLCQYDIEEALAPMPEKGDAT